MRRARLALTSLALAGVAAVGVGATTGTASATSGGYLYPGYDTLVSSWVFGNTTLCLSNRSSYAWGDAQVAGWGGAGPVEHVYVAPLRTNCISRAWGGVPVKVTNVSPAVMTWTSY
jgi:hypothetical protein